METYSQAGQDIWVRETLPGITHGTFVDCGCSHPVELSNTYALERMGWNGWLVDADENACKMCREKRSSMVVHGDGRYLHWLMLVGQTEIDYLSLDCDEVTLEVLAAFLASGIRFKVATVEHDSYRFGDRLRPGERRLLTEAGYVLARPDVESQGCVFEDWWVAPDVGRSIGVIS